MAGRGRLPHPMIPARGPLPPVGVGGLRGFAPGIRSPLPIGLDGLPPAPPALIEEKLATQHAEIQRLLTENQRLAATHVALRQELAAAQQEVQRLQQVIGGIHAEKEQQFRAIADKSAKMEVELRAMDAMKMELQRAQTEVQKLLGNRQELTTQVQQLNQEMHRFRNEAQQVPALKMEIDGLRQEIQRARTAFEFEKKANTELLEQRTAMEKNLVSMAREVEKLRAELTNYEKKTRSTFVGPYGPESGFSAVPPYGDAYVMNPIGGMADNGAPYATAAGVTGAANWAAYDIQRGGVGGVRR